MSAPAWRDQASNENFEWGQAEKGIVAFARLFVELAGPNGALAAAKTQGQEAGFGRSR